MDLKTFLVLFFAALLIAALVWMGFDPDIKHQKIACYVIAGAVVGFIIFDLLSDGKEK